MIAVTAGMGTSALTWWQIFLFLLCYACGIVLIMIVGRRINKRRSANDTDNNDSEPANNAVEDEEPKV